MRQGQNAILIRQMLALGILLALALATPAARAQTGAAEAGKEESTAVQTLRSDAAGLLFELHTPAATQDGRGALHVPGLDTTITEPGAPALPVYRAWIALPPQASVTARVTTLDSFSRTVAAVPPVPARGFSGGIPEADALLPVDSASLKETETVQPDAAIYGRDQLYPQASYTLSAPQQAGDLRLVHLTLYPLRYNGTRSALEQATRLRVELSFSGAVLAGEQEESNRSATEPDLWQALVLNPPPASWRARPESAAETQQAADITLPQGQPVYKIEVLEDGIYEISGADLAAVGMDLNTVSVNTLQMMHRGEEVAYQFINGGGGAAFEPLDKIRFYGWAFDGSRYEDLFIDRNYYWLWAGGTPKLITAVGNEAAAGHQARTSFPTSSTYWPHRSFYGGGSIDWDASPNDPTPWHADRVKGISQASGATKTYKVDIPDPVTSAAAAITVEMTSRQSSTSALPPHTYTVAVDMNGTSTGVSGNWQDQANVNVSGAVLGSLLRVPGDTGYPLNNVRLHLGGLVVGDVNQIYKLDMHVTRITVDYVRELLALGDELLFGADAAGAFAFAVEGFTESSSANALVWDVSDRLQPVAITLGAGDINASAGAFRWDIRRTLGVDGRLIATASANLRSPAALSQVIPGALAPAGGAEWLAISHESLLPAAQDLASHRAARSGLSTFVIDVQEIIDQIGYGYHLPTVIQSYLVDAYAGWDTPPAYLTLVGDATYNPRFLLCETCGTTWDENKPHLVAADLLFADRFVGLIPVDHTYAMLAGNDLLPEIGVARVPAEDLAEAQSMVAKIVRFETNFDQVRPEQNHFLFLADNTDGGGNFCQENVTAANELPQSISKTQLCLANAADLQPGTDALRTQLFDEINNVGALFLNYRGHGSITEWAASPPIMTIDDTALWQNPEPMMVISADCWDGNFAFPDKDGLGETYFGLDTYGTAAHWSSAGLGYSVEHSILHSGFYHAIFHERLLRIGDATKYAKIDYLNRGQDPSEALAFTLLGDSAMDATAARADISGVVSLQGRSGPAVTPGTVRLIDLDGNFAPQTIATTAVNGAFLLRGVPVAPGGSNYRFEAEHSLYLKATLEQVVTAVAQSLPAVTLRGGNANNDTTINILDLGCMGSSYNNGIGTCGGTGSTDINGDGLTNISDLAMAGGNYGLSNFRPWAP